MELEAFRESEKCRLRQSIRGIKSDMEDGKDNSQVLSGTPVVEDGGGFQREMVKMAAQISQLRQLARGREEPGGDGAGRGGGSPAAGKEVNPVGLNASLGEGLTPPPEKGFNGTRMPFDISRIKCYRCDRMGHYVRDCPDLPKRQAGSSYKEGNLNG
jgi:hypothetical protein